MNGSCMRPPWTERLRSTLKCKDEFGPNLLKIRLAHLSLEKPRPSPLHRPVPAGRFDPDTLISRERLVAHLESSSTAVREKLKASGHDPRHYTMARKRRGP